MVDFPNPPEWLRGTAAKVAASTVVPDKGALITVDDGTHRVGDGVTQLKNLPVVLNETAANAKYLPLPASGTASGFVPTVQSNGSVAYAAQSAGASSGYDGGDLGSTAAPSSPGYDGGSL